MKRLLACGLALSLSTIAMAQALVPSSGRWETSNQTSPLTGASSTAAVVESSNQLLNMLGNHARASLVIWCGEGGLAVAEVVSHDGQNFAGQLKTMAVWRIDDGKIQANLWDMDKTRTAAGEFKSKNALKLLPALRPPASWWCASPVGRHRMPSSTLPASTRSPAKLAPLAVRK